MTNEEYCAKYAFKGMDALMLPSQLTLGFRSIHSTLFGAGFVEVCITEPMFAADSDDRHARFGLPQEPLIYASLGLLGLMFIVPQKLRTLWKNDTYNLCETGHHVTEIKSSIPQHQIFLAAALMPLSDEVTNTQRYLAVGPT